MTEQAQLALDGTARRADAVRLSRRTLRTIRGNLFWAFAYNVAAIPLAMADRLNPIVAAGRDGVLEPVRRVELASAARGRSSIEHRYDKEALVGRLHRVEGQVRGIERMVEDDRYCIEILTQISDVSSAPDSLALEALDDHVKHCVAGAIASGDEAEAGRKSREELLDALHRFARTR